MKKIYYCIEGCNNIVSKEGNRCRDCYKKQKQSAESNLKRSKKLKGRILTEDHKLKIGLGNKGKIILQETRDKLRESKTKHGKYRKDRHNYCKCGKEISPMAKRCRKCDNKSRTNPLIIVYCIECEKQLSKNAYYHGYERCNSCASKRKVHKSNCQCCSCKAKRREYNGKNSPHYIDGRTLLRDSIRSLKEYSQWHKSIFQRDNYTCQDCGDNKGGNLNVHHKRRFSVILSEFLQRYSQFSPIEDREILLRLAITYAPFWDINNGRTLCKKCHKKYDIIEEEFAINSRRSYTG